MCLLTLYTVSKPTVFPSVATASPITQTGSQYFSSICFQSSSAVNSFLKSRNSEPLPQKRGHWQSRSLGVNKALHIPAPAGGQCHRIIESKQIDSQFVKQQCSTLKTVYLHATLTMRWTGLRLALLGWKRVLCFLIQVNIERLCFIKDALIWTGVNNVHL